MFQSPIVAYGAAHSDATSIHSPSELGSIEPNTQNIAQKSLGPCLMQQRIQFFESIAAALRMGGVAPDTHVQEERSLEKPKQHTGPFIGMHNEYQGAHSMQEDHLQVPLEQESASPSIQVLPMHNAQILGPLGPPNTPRPLENPNLSQLHAAAKIGTTPEQVPEVGPEVQSAHSSCPVLVKTYLQNRQF